MAFDLASTEEIIADIAAGKMVILADDEDRENEGDLIVAGDKITPEVINFMSKFGRGLICLCMTGQQIERLGLKPMVEHNGTRHGTAFTESIDAANLDVKPVSATGRAQTVKAAINPDAGPQDISVPGRIFPLRAREGGVLARTGHTEASVDLARLAGLNPSAVICEIMKEDGTMARMGELLEYAKEHGLKVGTIRDLILYRRRHDKLIERIGQGEVETQNTGIWSAIGFRNRIDNSRTVALVKGRIDGSQPTLVRMHVTDIMADIFDVLGPRHNAVKRSMRQIEAAGSGVIVLVNSSSIKSTGDFIEASTGEIASSKSEILKDFGIGAEILADLGVHDMVLLSNSHVDYVGLEAYGLNIVETRAILED